MGALTLKSFSDESREWELLENENVDITDGFGASLRVSVRENRIFLVEPYEIENPWITDRGRMFFEGFLTNHKNFNNDFLDWASLFDQINYVIYFLDHLKFIKLNVETKAITIVFKRVCEENLDILNKIEDSFSIIKLRLDTSCLSNVDLEENYQISNTLNLKNLKYSSLAILIGLNTRYENNALNNVLRQRYLKGNFCIMVLGPLVNLTIPVVNVSANNNILTSVFEGTHQTCQEIVNATRPIFLTNSHFFKQSKHTKFNSVLSTLKHVNEFFEGKMSVMSDKIESTGIHEFKNYKPLTVQEFLSSNVIYYVNTDLNSNLELKTLIQKIVLYSLIFKNYTEVKTNFVFVQSDSSNEKTVSEKVLINKNLLDKKTLTLYNFLPTKGIFEENFTYKNVEGTTKKSTKIVNFQKKHKTSWQLLRFLYFTISKTIFFSQKKDFNLMSNILKTQLNQSNFINFLFKPTASLSAMNSFLENSSTPFLFDKNYSTNNFKPLKSCIKKIKIKYWLDDFFIGGNKDCLSANSLTLIKCSLSVRTSSTNFFNVNKFI